MKSRVPAIVAAVSGFALVLSACSGGGDSSSGSVEDQDPNAEVKFWSFTGIGAQGALEEYMAKQPQADVKLTEVGSTTETATALTAALAGGEVPDLVMIQNDDLPKFVANPENFVDLRTLGGDTIGDEYLDWATGFATAEDGSIIGIPTDVGGLGFAYRADLFEQAGLPTDPAEVAAAWSTWDDFIAMGEQYTAATGKPFVDNVETSIFFTTVNQVENKYYSDSGELIYDSNPEVEEAFDIAVRTYEAGISANIAAWSSGWDPGKANGAFAVTVAPSWMLAGIKNAAPDSAGDWRLANVPGVGGNWGGSVIAIPARAENKAGAWQYIETMMSAQGQTDHFEATGTFPAAKDALTSEAVLGYTDDFYGDSQIGQVISDSVMSYKFAYNGPDTGAIGTGFLNALADMQAGNVPPGEAWDKGLNNVQEAIGN